VQRHAYPDVQIAADEFIRRFSIRAPKWMWLIGAGASAGAGVATAENMIWDFKRFLYRTAEGIPPQAVADLSNPVVRSQIQGYFDTEGSHPPLDSEEEYAHYFELAYPLESDRRTYIEAKTADAKPSYGHLALAALLKAECTRAIWTTNFDKLVEDACAQIFGTTSRLTVASIDNSAIAGQAIAEDRWPILGKLHGDFGSRRLKNTPDELREQDAKMRRAVAEASRRFGLVVAGYSGRDDSVMRALEDGCSENGFPAGLFWLQYGERPASQRIVDLIQSAREAGIDAAVVPIGTFDEVLGDLVRQQEGLEESLLPHLSDRRKQVSDAPLEGRGSGWPVIRTNALEVVEWPTICRRIGCEIGGIKEVRRAVRDADIDAFATRTRAGVLAFGSDTDLRRAFAPFKIGDFDLHAIEKHRLYVDTQERELILSALARSLANRKPLRVERRRGSRVLVPTGQGGPLEVIERETQRLSGTLKASKVTWTEAVTLHLGFHLDRLWLLIEPQLWFSRRDTAAARIEAASFGRERFARRYNSQWNSLLSAWIELLLGDRTGLQLRSLEITDGVDAAFKISETTAFSRPEVGHAA
jgi:NAD-dependent SIR2 family protein deacetylase